MPLQTSRTAAQTAELLRSKSISAVEVAQEALAQAKKVEPQVRAFLTLDEDTVLDSAREAQARLDAGEGGLLTGVPIAIKDNISTKGTRTTCASKILETYVPPYDAGVIQFAKSSGMTLFGKTNLDEFAMGSSCESSAFHPSFNPWDTTRSPGGSSGGSAAVVAAGVVPLSLGSDTGGSVRMPASLTGTVGFKPTYGRVSRYGLVAFASSLDQIGPFATNVEDCAMISHVISGHDGRDSTSLVDAKIKLDGLKDGSLKGLKIAMPRETLGAEIQAGVSQSVDATIEALRREGAIVTEVSVPTIPLGVATYYVIAPCEASSNLARFDGVRYGTRLEGEGHIGAVASTRGKLFGHEVKARIMIGTYALSAGYYDAYYTQALKVRAQMAAEFEALFQDFDVVMSPTCPIVSFPVGELSADPMALKLLDYCTVPANMGGFPAISLPCGLSGGLPVGIHLMGPVMGDERLLQIAYAVEQALPAGFLEAPVLS
jgi:aspartyl-tRNA(Asn)/glutamyl-tRNA(Gln) amidotransferase subunit A